MTPPTILDKVKTHMAGISLREAAGFNAIGTDYSILEKLPMYNIDPNHSGRARYTGTPQVSAGSTRNVVPKNLRLTFHGHADMSANDVKIVKEFLTTSLGQAGVGILDHDVHASQGGVTICMLLPRNDTTLEAGKMIANTLKRTLQ